MDRISSVSDKLHDINAFFSQLVAERTIGEVFGMISAKLVELLDVDHATIALSDRTRRYLRVEAEHPQLSASLVGERIRIQDSATQRDLLNHRKPVVACDLNGHALISESPGFQQIVQALDIRSLLIVPMATDGNTIGTISVETVGRTCRFSNEDVELCQTAANQTAAFVATARLREEQKKYRRQADLLGLVPSRAAVSVRGEKVAQTLFDELAKVLQFKKASLQLIVDCKRTLVGALGFDKSRAHPWLLRPVEADPIVREIVHTRKPMILPDTGAADHWEGQAGTTDVNSWIGMPLIFQGETIGILTLDHDQRGFYADIPEHVLARLDELTDQAAHDIGDTYHLEVAQHQIQAIEIIRQFAETVATKLDLDDLLLAIATTIFQGLECTRSNLFLLEQVEGRGALVSKAACREGACKIAPTQVLPEPRPGGLPCPVQAAFQSGESVFIDDLDEDRRFDFTHELYRDARSIIVVPLKIADQTIGAVLAINERSGWFSSADQLLLETLTRQAASAIERDFGLDLIHSIGNKILGATEVGAVLEEIVSGAMKLTHTDSGVIYVLSEDGAKIIQSFKSEGSVHPTPRLDNPAGITRAVIFEKKILEVRDIEDDDRVNPERRVNPELRGKYRSMFAVPLLLGESVVGVLYLNCRTMRGLLTETERSLLSTLAGQAALAIQATRLYEQIKDSEAMWRSLVDHIPPSVFRKDADLQFASANASFCRSLGIEDMEEVIGKDDFDFYPKEDAEKYRFDDRDVMLTKKTKQFDEINYPRGASHPIWVRVVKTPVLDATEQVVGVQAIFWDITEEKQMTERWRSLVEQSPDSIVVHQGGKITLANPAAVRLFGVSSAADLKDRSILDFIDESSRGRAHERLGKLVKRDIPPMEEMRVRRTTGETIDVEVTSRPGPGESEVQVVFHDVTRAKTLLREMHHRVRRSFNQVTAFLTLQEQFTEDPEVLHAFNTIRERIQAMALVHTILYRTGRESDVEMELYLKDLRGALLQEGSFSEKVDVDFSAKDVILNEKRATACGLIVTELVSNSLLHAFPPEHSPQRRGRVSVSLCPREDMFRLVVSDNGVGMLGPLRDPESMGLSLVRSLVEDDLKGVMHVATSDERGTTEAGTCFTIDFPRTERRAAANGG